MKKKWYRWKFLTTKKPPKSLAEVELDKIMDFTNEMVDELVVREEKKR